MAFVMRHVIYPLTIVLAVCCWAEWHSPLYLVEPCRCFAVGYGEINGLIVTRFSAGTTYITVVIFDVLFAFLAFSCTRR